MTDHEPKQNNTNDELSRDQTPWTVSGDLRDPEAVQDFLRLGPGAAQKLIDTASHPDYEHHYREVAQRELAKAAFQSLRIPGTGGFGVVEGKEARYYISLRPDDLGAKIAPEDLERYGLPELDAPVAQASQEPERVLTSEPAPLPVERKDEVVKTVEEDTRPVNERLSRLAGEVKVIVEDSERILDGIKDERNRFSESVDAFEDALNGGRSAITRIRDLLGMVTPENILDEANDSVTKLRQLVEDYATAATRANQLVDDGLIETSKASFKNTVEGIREAAHKSSNQEGIPAEEVSLYDQVSDTIRQISADADNLSFMVPADTDAFPSAYSLDMNIVDLHSALIKYGDGSVSLLYIQDALDRLEQAFPRLQETLNDVSDKRSKFDGDLRAIKDALGDVYVRINSASRELPQIENSSAPAEIILEPEDERDDGDFSEGSVLDSGKGGYWTPDQKKDPTYLEERRTQLRKNNPRPSGGFRTPGEATDDMSNPFGV